MWLGYGANGRKTRREHLGRSHEMAAHHDQVSDSALFYHRPNYCFALLHGSVSGKLYRDMER